MSDVAVVDHLDHVDDVDSLPGIPSLESFRLLAAGARDAAVMSVERELRRLLALQAAMITVVEESASFTDDGHRTAMNWWEGVVNTSRGQAVLAVQTARLLADRPAVAEAYNEGRVGTEQVRLLARLHANRRCRDLLPEWEPFLLDQAVQLTFTDFVRVCQRWLLGADPDGAHRDQVAARENRSVSSVTVGAGHMLHVEGDGVTGEVMREILDAHAQAEYLQDLADRQAKHGEAAEQFPLARTARQRRYDALMAIFLKAANTTATSAASTRLPLVNIVCTPDQLVNALRLLFDQDPVQAPAGELPLSQTVNGTPVDPLDLALAALCGQIRRVLVDTAGRVLDLGRRRLFTGATREAVLVAFGTRCTWPGCGQTHGIQIDHLAPWAALSGVTNPLNGGPECGPHNRSKHEGRISVTRDQTGWHYYRPDGTEICPRG
jgi:Domain of unknown function (DUF222)